MQNVQDSLQPSCTLTNARLCSVISVIGTSRKLFAVEIGDTATTGGPSSRRSMSSATRERSAAPTTRATPGSAASSSGARWA